MTAVEPSTALPLHDLLLWADSRVPDEVVTQARYWLADGSVHDVVSSLMFAISAANLRPPATYLGPLRQLLGPAGFDASQFVDAGTEETTPRMVVAPVGPDAFDADDVPLYWSLDLSDPASAGLDPWDREVVETARQDPAVSAVWRSWRYGLLDVPAEYLDVDLATATLCYLAMVEEPDDLIPVTARLQGMFAAPEPMVRTFVRAQDLPSHHRTALDCAALIWARRPGSRIRVATGQPPAGAAAPPRVQRYLALGTQLVVDLDPPGHDGASSRAMRTDGMWIWPDELDPSNVEPALLAHVAAQPEEPPEVDEVTLHRAIATLVEDAGTRAEPAFAASRF